MFLAEAVDGPFSLADVDQVLKRRSKIGVSDCRSLYDHLNSLDSGGTLDDKRATDSDIAIIRQSIQRCGLEPRWCPTEPDGRRCLHQRPRWPPGPFAFSHPPLSLSASR